MKKFSLKSFIIALCLVASTSILASCGGDNKNNEDENKAKVSSESKIETSLIEQSTNESNDFSEQSIEELPHIGNIATELSFSKEEFFKWLNGTSDTYINDGTEEIINIHNCGHAEHARSLINRKKLYWLTLNEVIFEPSDTINVAFHDEKSVRVFFNKPISFVFFFYDQSYDEALNNGITALIEQLNKEIPNSWNMEKYELIKYSLYDHEKNEYIPTDVYYSQNNNQIYFVFNGCMVSIYDRDGLFAKDDFSKLGFVSAT